MYLHTVRGEHDERLHREKQEGLMFGAKRPSHVRGKEACYASPNVCSFFFFFNGPDRAAPACRLNIGTVQRHSV